MSDTAREKPAASSRAKFLRIIPLVAVALIDVLFLAMLDSMFYANKRALIPDSPQKNEMLEPINPMITELRRYREQILNWEESSKKYFERAKAYLEKTVPAILEKDNVWFRVELIGADKEVIYDYSVPDKIKICNDWTNCLFSRSFYAPVGQNQLYLTVYYATPKGWPEIERMVGRYRIYAILFVVNSWIIYGLLFFYVFRPLQRVGSAIEGTIRADNAVLIDSPRHAIERAFNRLAKNQREVLFGMEIERIVDELHSLADDAVVVERFLQNTSAAVRKVYRFDGVSAYRFHTERKNYEPLDPNQSIDPDSPISQVGEDGIIVNEPGSMAIVFRMSDQVLGGLSCVMKKRRSPESGELLQMAQEIKKQSENGLARAFARSRTLTEERNRFGINLATNMGHDLTNIIASGKWDLDTIQRAQAMGIVTLDARKGTFYIEAVNGLRNNLSFLQEMVNIYRSFGYTRRPRYERTSLGAIFEDVVDLFKKSSSQGITIKLDFSSAIETIAEPRLLRMALFNLLANAAQAIRRYNTPQQPGEILVTLCENGENTVTLSVSDNGPGIRDENGIPLGHPEIDRIFQSGYSTKDSHSGGGLGLSWVKSIVEDFHGGIIRAENRPEGGARIVLQFPKDHVPINNME